MLLHLLNVLTAYRPNKFSKKIKKETKQIHDNIEKHPFFLDLLSGKLPDFKYAAYLYNLIPVYSSVEMFFFKNTSNPDLIRSKPVIEDFQNYNKTLNLDLGKITFNSEWIEYFFSKPSFLKKTDLYVRWLADMYGGQFLKNKVKFNSKYEFVTLRNSLRIVRKLIEEDINEQNVDKFIKETKLTYEFHKKILDKVYELTETAL